MSDENKNLLSKIRELEKEIEIKDQELDRHQKELLKVNSALENMIQEMNHELSLAGVIQKFLSPTELPNISGVELSTKFIPGTKTGGDYFDIFELEDKLKFGILLTSSSGYAMSALFLTVLIKLSTQIEARKGKDPHAVIEMMTQELLPHIQNQDQASVFYAVIDRRTFEMKYSSAGNIIAFLQAQGSDKLVRFEASTGPIKRDYNQVPLTHNVFLGARDRLILCTESLGTPEFLSKAILRAPRSGVHELRNEIFYQVSQQSKNIEPNRDQTVIVTEVKDRVIKLANK